MEGRHKETMNMEQKQMLNDRKLTADEFAKLLQARLQNINGELSNLFNDLSPALNDYQREQLNAMLHDFQCNELNVLYDKLKTVYF